MIRSVKALLLLSLPLLGAACDRVPTGAGPEADEPLHAPADRPAFYTSATTICSSQSVPSGYVIMAGRSELNCSGYTPGYYNAYWIAIPGVQENVCHISPIPSGYVITSSSRYSSCPSYEAAYNQYLIKKPGYEETVCWSSPIPSNYTVLYYTGQYSCPGYSPGTNNAKRIRRI